MVQQSDQIPIKTEKIGRVGVIGAGQLAMMLCDAAKSLGLKPLVLAGSPDEPAAQMPGANVVTGRMDDSGVFRKFANEIDCIAFESELIDLRALQTVLHGLDLAQVPACYPAIAAMEVCSNKKQQKEMLDQGGIATAPWLLLERTESSCVELDRKLRRRFASGYVLKWAHGGYDGLGTFLAHPSQTVDAASMQQFLRKGWQAGSEIFAEEMIPFTSEIAVISSRTPKGKYVQWPAVVTLQRHGVCAEVQGPAEKIGIPFAVTDTAQGFARAIGERLNLVGTYAVEFFVTSDGRVLVNEIAPRVHNSGHFSLDSAATSQFTNHWLALADGELGDVNTSPFFGMVNILGPEGVCGKVTNPFSLDSSIGQVYWYGKMESRTRRKLGHVNCQAETFAELQQKLDLINKKLQVWRPMA